MKLLKRIKERIKDFLIAKYQCPICGRVFDTYRGLRIHEGKTHNKPDLPWDWLKENEQDRMFD